MTQQRTPIDFIAYDADGKVVLLAEAKSRRGTSASWAAKLRRNMLAHSYSLGRNSSSSRPRSVYMVGGKRIRFQRTFRRSS